MKIKFIITALIGLLISIISYAKKTESAISGYNETEKGKYDSPLTDNKSGVKYFLPQQLTDDIFNTFPLTKSRDNNILLNDFYTINLKTDNVIERKIGKTYNYIFPRPSPQLEGDVSLHVQALLYMRKDYLKFVAMETKWISNPK